MKHSQKAIKNSMQNQINEEVKKVHDSMWKEYLRQEPITGYTTWKRLRSCSASVLTIDKYHILKSYDTIIACVDRETGITYDFLRMVYGYTSTSAQHIAKFHNDYGWGLLWNNELKRYRPI